MNLKSILPMVETFVHGLSDSEFDDYVQKVYEFIEKEEKRRGIL